MTATEHQPTRSHKRAYGGWDGAACVARVRLIDRIRMEPSGNNDPRHLTEGKTTWRGGVYPKADVEGTDMFRPFFRRRRTWLVLCGIVVLIALAFGYRPEPPSDLGLEADKVGIGIAIFACIACLWLTEALPLAATALLVPLLAVTGGLMDLKAALAGFAHPLIFLFFGGFALASAMAYQGLDLWIARAVIRAGRGSFFRVSLLMFGVTAVLSMWMSNTATTAMMMPLVVGILGRAGVGKGKTAVFLLLGVAYAASVGGIGTLVGSPPNAIAAQNLGLGFADWMRFGIPAVVVLLPLMTAVLWLVCRPDAGGCVSIDGGTFVFNWHRRMTLVIFAATAGCWIFGAKLGAWLGIGNAVDTVVALAAVLALLYFRVLRWRDIDRGTDWGVLLLFGGGISLSNVLGTSGASVFLAHRFVAVVEHWPAFAVTGAVVAFVIFLTELSSNTATAALLVPIFASVAVEIDMLPAELVIPLAVAASCAFMLPVATPPNAIVFGTGLVPQRSMMRVGLVLNLTFVIALTLLAMVL